MNSYAFSAVDPANHSVPFETYGPEINLLYERYQFFQRCQRSEESLLEYVEDVKRLAKSCAFDTLEESLVRDRVIFGIRDVELKEEIIENGGDPSLCEAVLLCQGRFRLRKVPHTHVRAEEHNGIQKVAVNGKTRKVDLYLTVFVFLFNTHNFFVLYVKF